MFILYSGFSLEVRMRISREAWQELSDLFQKYSGIADQRGDVTFAQEASVRVATVYYMRVPGVGNMPPKEEVLKAVAHLRDKMSVGIHRHMLDLVNEAYKPARRETARLGLGDRLNYRSRDPIL